MRYRLNITEALFELELPKDVLAKAAKDVSAGSTQRFPLSAGMLSQVRVPSKWKRGSEAPPQWSLARESSQADRDRAYVNVRANVRPLPNGPLLVTVALEKLGSSTHGELFLDAFVKVADQQFSGWENYGGADHGLRAYSKKVPARVDALEGVLSEVEAKVVKVLQTTRKSDRTYSVFPGAAHTIG